MFCTAGFTSKTCKRQQEIFNLFPRSPASHVGLPVQSSPPGVWKMVGSPDSPSVSIHSAPLWAVFQLTRQDVCSLSWSSLACGYCSSLRHCFFYSLCFISFLLERFPWLLGKGTMVISWRPSKSEHVILPSYALSWRWFWVRHHRPVEYSTTAQPFPFAWKSLLWRWKPFWSTIFFFQGVWRVSPLLFWNTRMKTLEFFHPLLLFSKGYPVFVF